MILFPHKAAASEAIFTVVAVRAVLHEAAFNHIYAVTDLKAGVLCCNRTIAKLRGQDAHAVDTVLGFVAAQYSHTVLAFRGKGAVFTVIALKQVAACARLALL